MSREWEQSWFNPLEPFLHQGAEPSLPDRSGSQSSVHVSSLLSSAYKKSPLILSAGFPVGFYLQGSTIPGGKGKKAWLAGRALRTAHWNTTLVALSCNSRHDPTGKATQGCTATASWGWWTGIQRQQISLIWREGEYAEASTMSI